jgi:hypothetical protein
MLFHMANKAIDALVPQLAQGLALKTHINCILYEAWMKLLVHYEL